MAASPAPAQPRVDASTAGWHVGYAQADITPAAGEAMLAVKDLEAWYGESHVLHGVGIEVRAGEVVTLLGRNGAGKTSTLRAIMGLVGKRAGSIRFNGREIHEELSH